MKNYPLILYYHEKKLDLINEILQNSKSKGLTHHEAEEKTYNGKNIRLNEKSLINFGSCSYMGLETDHRLKKAAINAIEKFGISYSSSRAYLSSPLYSELECLLESLFDAPVVLFASVSIGHQGVIPIITEQGDTILLDQQVHTSVQDAARKVQCSGVGLQVVRHNDLDTLEQKIIELSSQTGKIWYMCDGVYSMYGDVAPIKALIALAERYPAFHIYVDDAHGMSCFGNNGTGFVMSQTPLHPNMVLCTGMAKAFGAIGGLFVFHNKALAEKVRNCAGPLIFSGQQSSAVLGASIASAKIHLSEEINIRQNALAAHISYCHQLLKQHGLPNISDARVPVFFIAVGTISMASNLVKRMLNEGFYINGTTFPAVPEGCSGIRFTITLHHTVEDIKNMVEALAKHFFLALHEEGRNLQDIQRAFRRIATFEISNEEAKMRTERIRETLHKIKVTRHSEITLVEHADDTLSVI